MRCKQSTLITAWAPKEKLAQAKGKGLDNGVDTRESPL